MIDQIERVINSIGPKQGKLLILGTSPTAEDKMFGVPFKNSAGRELYRMLEQAGIDKNSCMFTTVFHCHPFGNDVASFCTDAKSPRLKGFPAIRAGKYLKPEYETELLRLAEEIKNFAPNLILALGQVPLMALTLAGGLGKFRGSVGASIQGPKFLATYSPEMDIKNWDQRVVVLADLRKALVEMEFPERRIPNRMILINPTIDELEHFYANHLAFAKEIAVDIETKSKHVRTIGFAPTPNLAISIPLMDSRNPDNNYWKTEEEEIRAMQIYRKVLTKPAVKVMQNGSYDLQYLWKKLGLPVYGFGVDTTLAHHALYPELEKNLGFLGSIYTSEPSWKMMRTRAKDIEQKKEE